MFQFKNRMVIMMKKMINIKYLACMDIEKEEQIFLIKDLSSILNFEDFEFDKNNLYYKAKLLTNNKLKIFKVLKDVIIKYKITSFIFFDCENNNNLIERIIFKEDKNLVVRNSTSSLFNIGKGILGIDFRNNNFLNLEKVFEGSGNFILSNSSKINFIFSIFKDLDNTYYFFLKHEKYCFWGNHFFKSNSLKDLEKQYIDYLKIKGYDIIKIELKCS